MDILIKELKSSNYIIYLLVDNTLIEAYITKGFKNKDLKIKEIESKYKIDSHQIIKNIK